MGGNGLVIATTPLRGYDDRTVGPRNSQGNVIGGRVMTRYTSELRFAVTLDPIPLYLIAFAEAGNVWQDINKTDPFDLRRSVGFGARILINPIGLIGFDLGYGFDRQLTDGKDPGMVVPFSVRQRILKFESDFVVNYTSNIISFLEKLLFNNSR